VRPAEMFPRTMRILLFAGLVAFACARPDADAEAEADPAYLDVNGQLVSGNGGLPGMPPSMYPGRVPSMPGAYPDNNGNIFPGGLPWGGQNGNSCGAVDECCNMAQENCCLENKRCYYVYKRVCPDQVTQSTCRRNIKTHYQPYMERSCRNVTEPQRLEVPVLSCKSTKQHIMVKYNVTLCERYGEQVNKTVDVTSQYIIPTEDDKCVPFKRCKMTEVPKTMTTTNLERQCKEVPYQTQSCKPVTEDVPPMMTTKVIYESVSVPVCRKIPRSVCSPSGCSDQGCTNPTYPDTCSTTQVNTQDVCNTCNTGLGVGGRCVNQCVQVRTPQCGTGSCQRGPQYCCRTEYQTVCDNKMQKVPRTVQVSVPRPPIIKTECQMITNTREVCSMVNVPSQYEIMVKKCESEDDQHCFKIPKFNMDETHTKQNLTAFGVKCNYVTKQLETRVEVPAGEKCQENKKPVTLLVTKTVCDRNIPRTKRIPIPEEICQPGQTPQCRNIPELVCQDSCSQSTKCNYCQEALSTGTMAQCQTSTCPNFISAPF
jgi:hypothetical protein